MTLNWFNISDKLPDIGVQVLVETTNGKFTTTQLNEIKVFNGKTILRWKGSRTFSDSVIRWKYILKNDEMKTLITDKLSQQNIDINTINNIINSLCLNK